MKNILLKIMGFILFVSVSVETTGILSKVQLSSIFTNSTENSNPEEGKTEKEDSKDKTFHYFSLAKFTNSKSSFFFLQDIDINLTAFLSLPERPPKLG